MRSISLRSKNNDISNIINVTLGGDEIDEKGNWDGKWEDLNTSSIDERAVGITIPSASALLIQIKD